MIKRQKHVKTQDNFHPPFDDGTVHVSLGTVKNKGANRWWVSVWGDDDYGLGLDSMGINEAYDVYHKIKDGVTIQWLKNAGFEQL